ncbi:hypothetical protein RND71_022636 [Anisodus tanguticus]|uniref:DUF2828 domain-containing protein n=1 Tax=Anisodus tanguticus TaxID=243964 RepID=A0AAE1VAX9_9SOLA|nr:hypothetical protein RND71_022636 [Anisodus tanguticus]
MSAVTGQRKIQLHKMKLEYRDTKDMKLYNEGKFYELSLAAKWCPSLDSSYDKTLLMCESIGTKLFPREDYIEYHDLEDVHYAYRVRDRLRCIYARINGKIFLINTSLLWR